MMARTTSITMQNLVEIARRTSEREDEMFIKKIKSEKHHISSSRSGVRRAISTKFCMVIEVARAIILGLIPVSYTHLTLPTIYSV